jgi:hypothetical protein
VEIGAEILYFSQFALSAMAAALCVMLFRHGRQCGWLMLGVAFLSPFGFLLLRLVHGQTLFTYRSISPGANGMPQLTIRYQIPGFYIVVVVALLWLLRDVRRGK